MWNFIESLSRPRNWKVRECQGFGGDALDKTGYSRTRYQLRCGKGRRRQAGGCVRTERGEDRRSKDDIDYPRWPTRRRKDEPSSPPPPRPRPHGNLPSISLISFSRVFRFSKYMILGHRKGCAITSKRVG